MFNVFENITGVLVSACVCSRAHAVYVCLSRERTTVRNAGGFRLERISVLYYFSENRMKGGGSEWLRGKVRTR